MEKTVTGKFITDIYGSTPALGAEGILQHWIKDKTNDWLLSWADKIKKKGETADECLEKILSVFHRDEGGNPIIGNWMLRRCLITTGQTIFNAMKDKTHPKKTIIPMAINIVYPLHIQLFNGNLVEQPHGIKTYTTTVNNGGKKVSFFTAYEYIKAGVTFTATIVFDETLLSEEHFDRLMSKSGLVGVGAYRERFGKFQWQAQE
jgi:hypothetical protein